MPLATTTRLGPYEIVAPIGIGGMGEVYRARDTRLNRTVAIKIIRSDLSWLREFRQRFEREAQVISSLNHPHICALFDIGEEGGLSYIVMEYLEGETLSHRLERGALPLNEAIKIGADVASALDNAHRQKLVHRDLKPGNIMLTRNGAKLMDFGLARPTTEIIASGAATTRPTPVGTTPSSHITSEGTIVGTFQYMAPEVLEGAAADSRSDVFSFGCVLYEMITGKPAFTGKSRISVLAAILQSQPESLLKLQPLTPSTLEKIVLGCLEKDPEKRWQSASDLSMELSWIGQGGSPETITLRPKNPWLLWLSWALVLLLGLSTIPNLIHRPHPASAPLRRYSILLPANVSLAPSTYMPLGVGRPTLAISPDGNVLVFVGVVGNSTQLFLRTNDGQEPRVLPGTEGAHSPFLSPDGHWVGFFAGEKLKKVSLDGGTPLTLCEAKLGFGGSWGNDGWIYFTPSEYSPIQRVPDAGGLRTSMPSNQINPSISQSFPVALPGGKAILFSNSRLGIGLYKTATGESRWLSRSGTYPRWSPTGHIVYVDEAILWAMPFDLKRLEPTGSPIFIGEHVRTEQQGGAQFDLTQDGTLVYAKGTDLAEASLVWVSRNGTITDVGLPPRRYGEFRISPNGEAIALTIFDQARYDLWLFDIERHSLSRLTNDGRSRSPIWVRDGSKIIYLSLSGATGKLWEMAPDGNRKRQITVLDDLIGFPTSLTRGDAEVAMRGGSGANDSWIYAVNVASGQKRILWREPYGQGFPAVSPDGRWIAYFSDESGQWEIYVRPFGGLDTKWRVTTNGGEEPIWSVDSRKLFYRNRDRWMEVDIAAGSNFHAGSPKEVAAGPYINIPGYSYDVARDGRFLLLRSEDQEKKVTRIEVIENWFELLKNPKR